MGEAFHALADHAQGIEERDTEIMIRRHVRQRRTRPPARRPPRATEAAPLVPADRPAGDADVRTPFSRSRHVQDREEPHLALEGVAGRVMAARAWSSSRSQWANI